MLPPRVGVPGDDSGALRVEGTVAEAYPLRKLDLQQPRSAAANAFTLGDGPCGDDAAQVMTITLETKGSFEFTTVFFYDAWAERVQFLQRRYKVRIQGHGLVQTLWNISSGDDGSEDLQPCIVVAERHVLKRALERRATLFQLHRGLGVELTYEEPRQLRGLDQVHYEAPQTIHSRDLHTGPTTVLSQQRQQESVAPAPAAQPGRKATARGKRTLQQAAEAYTYTSLGDLVCGKASIYGVVVNMSLPKRTRGTDYSMTLDVVDESCPERRHATQIVVFFPTIEMMPKVLFVGDIIRFHRLEVKRYREALQGMSSSKFTRYVVIRENRLTRALEQQTCSQTWTFDDADAARARELLQWSKQALKTDTSLLPSYPQPPVLLANALFAGAYVDIVVSVLHVLVSEHSRTRLVVWDGSGESTQARDSGTRSSLAARLEGDSIQTPARGVLREIVFDSCWGLLQTFGFVSRLRSYWCRFRNLHVAEDSVASSSPGSSAAPSRHLVLRFREGSSIMFLPDNVQDVRDRVQLSASSSRSGSSAKSASSHESGGAAAIGATQPQQQAQPVSDDCATAPDQQQRPATPATATATAATAVRTIVPEFIRTNVPVTPLRDVQRSAVVPRKFHCVARFVRMWPSDIAKLTKRQASAVASWSSSSETYVYSFVVRLEDATGAIDAIVYGKDAEHFLQGIPPCDLRTSSSSRAVLEKRLTALLSGQQLHQCCVKSYYPPSASQDTGAAAAAASVRYRLFDTLLQ